MTWRGAMALRPAPMTPPSRPKVLTMKIKGSTALVTGANRGLGLAYAKALLAAGARKVYAGARDPSTVTLAGVVPLKLDVNSAEDIAAAVAACGDVDLIINNAGVIGPDALLSNTGMEA